MDVTAEVYDQRHLLEVDLVGLGGVEYLQVVLADLVEVTLVRGRGDAYLHELAPFEGEAELLDRHAVGLVCQIFDIAGDVAPVGEAFTDLEAEELLGGLDVFVVLGILGGEEILHG